MAVRVKIDYVLQGNDLKFEAFKIVESMRKASKNTDEYEIIKIK